MGMGEHIVEAAYASNTGRHCCWDTADFGTLQWVVAGQASQCTSLQCWWIKNLL